MGGGHWNDEEAVGVYQGGNALRSPSRGWQMRALSAMPIMMPVVVLAAATVEGVVMTLRRLSYDWRAYFVSLGSMIGRRLTQGLVQSLPFGLATSLLGFFWNHRLLDIPLRHAWSLALLLAGEEICYYWFHRVSHSVRLLWATHAVHHSPNDLNFAVAYQLGWTGELTGALVFFAPLVWLGFPPTAVLAAVALNLLYQFWLHTRWIPKLGPLEWLFNTPSHHRVHHACNREYLGRHERGANYGGMLILFDRMFDTFVAERDDVPCRYGLVKPLRSYNPLYIALHEWLAIGRDLIAARSWRDRFHFVCGPPNWRPPSPGGQSV
jgi:sterol desaturase/sphingolipid hydroxylase (fatty acid hydroxylase superfamily)